MRLRNWFLVLSLLLKYRNYSGSRKSEVCPLCPMPYAHGGLCPRRPMPSMPSMPYAHGGLCPMPTAAYALCPRRPMPYARESANLSDKCYILVNRLSASRKVRVFGLFSEFPHFFDLALRSIGDWLLPTLIP